MSTSRAIVFLRRSGILQGHEGHRARGRNKSNVQKSSVLEILLTMLDLDDNLFRYVQGRYNISYAERDTAFAHDVHSIASSNTVVQK